MGWLAGRRKTCLAGNPPGPAAAVENTPPPPHTRALAAVAFPRVMLCAWRPPAAQPDQTRTQAPI
eukprot:scaffold17267_cov123-Isochrysis_galbana.AAC.1